MCFSSSEFEELEGGNLFTEIILRVLRLLRKKSTYLVNHQETPHTLLLHHSSIDNNFLLLVYSPSQCICYQLRRWLELFYQIQWRNYREFNKSSAN